MGDFTGFSFGNWHSTDPTTGVVEVLRVSGGDRYDEELHPEIKDRTAEVPGLNGEYYFGSDYGTKTFDIDIAFDHLTEEQFRKLRQVFGTKKTQQLIFDERPYKYYMAKIESPIELSFVCFDEPNYTWEKIQTGVNEFVQGISGDFEHKVYDGTTRRIYKGEGKISLICYFPFAKSVFKVLPEEDSDWAVSSGILSADLYTMIDKYNNGSITIYNAGDIDTGFRLYLPAAVVQTATTITYEDTDSSLVLDAMTLKSGDEGVLVDTNSNLIIGVSSMGENQDGNAIYTTSGNLYNNYVNSGTFFHLEPNVIYNYSTLQIDGGGDGIQIFYDYLYF